MTQEKDLAGLGARYGGNAIREERSKLGALAVAPPPTVSPSVFNEIVDLEAGSKVPPFPLDAFPRWMREWVEEAAHVEQVPVDIAAVLALGTVATATMGKAKIDVFGGEPLNGYFLMVDRPGANKSGIFKRATEPLWAWWKDREAEFDKVLAEWAVDRDVAESKVKREKGRMSGKEADEGELGDIKQRLEDAYKGTFETERDKPRVDLRLCQDVTPETVAGFLQEARCVASLSPEGAEVFDGLGRYQNKGENMDVYLKAWGGDNLIVDRKNGTKIRVESPTLSILAMAQPKVLEGLRDPEGKRDGRGLLARFFWCVPRSLVGSRTFDDRRWDDGVRSSYEAALARLCGLPFPPADGLPMVRMNADALDVFGAFYTETERELRPGGDLAGIEATASKMRSHLARVAGWLHLADGRGFGEPIDGPTMTRADTIARYFLAHALVAHRMMDGPDDDTKVLLSLFYKAHRAARSKEGLMVDGCPAVSLRELFKKVKNKTSFPRTASVEAKLEVLEAHGYTKTIDRKAKGKIVLLNPEVPETPEGAGKVPAGSR